MNRTIITDAIKGIWRKTAGALLTGRAAASRALRKEGAAGRTITKAKTVAADVSTAISAAAKKIARRGGDNAAVPAQPEQSDSPDLQEPESPIDLLNPSFLKKTERYVWPRFFVLGMLLGTLSAISILSSVDEGISLLWWLMLFVYAPVAGIAISWWTLHHKYVSAGHAVCFCFIPIVFVLATNTALLFRLEFWSVYYSTVIAPLVALLLFILLLYWLKDFLQNLVLRLSSFGDQARLTATKSFVTQISVKPPHGKSWSIYLMQILGIGFITGSLTLGFPIGLTLSIRNFSDTMCLPDADGSILKSMAWPWLSSAAQPHSTAAAECSDLEWLHYIMVGMLTYGLILRLPPCLLARFRLYQGLKESLINRPFLEEEQMKQGHSPKLSDGGEINQTPLKENGIKADRKIPPIASSIPSPYHIIVWGDVPEFVQEFTGKQWGSAQKTFGGGENDTAPVKTTGTQSIVILTDGSKPPMEGLRNLLRQLTQYTDQMVLPLDWDRANEDVLPLDKANLNQWCQAIATEPGNWTVLQPPRPEKRDV